MKEINKQEALDVLSFWIALEVLSYQSFKDVNDLVKGTSDVILPLRDGLPWTLTKNAEKPKQNKQIFYEIVIGTIDAEKAIAKAL